MLLPAGCGLSTLSIEDTYIWMNNNNSVTIPFGYLDILPTESGHILTSSIDDGLTNSSPTDVNTALQLQEHSYQIMESCKQRSLCSTNWIVYPTEVLLLYAVDYKTCYITLEMIHTILYCIMIIQIKIPHVYMKLN